MTTHCLLHCNIHEMEIRGGGKKSAGNDRVLSNEHAHLLPSELTERLTELAQAGYRLTITVLASRDKRKPDVALQYQVPICTRHNCPAYAAATDHLEPTS